MSWRSKLSQVVQELRIHCCQTSPSSTPTRDFIVRNYADLKALNPTLPILIRECSGVQPRLWARYDFGVERSVALDGLTEHEIGVKLEEIVKQGSPKRNRPRVHSVVGTLKEQVQLVTVMHFL